MLKCYQAEMIKNRHTMAGRLGILMPLAVIALSIVLTKEYVVIDSYNWWYMGLMSAEIGIICGMAEERDRRLKNRGILSLPIRMRQIWDGKVLYGIRVLAVSMLILTLTTAAVSVGLKELFKFTFPIDIAIKQQLTAGVILFASSLWQIPMCLIFDQLFGNAVGLLLHVTSYGILSVILSLKPYFMAVPGGVAARLMCIVLKILPNGLPAKPDSMTFSPELLEPSGILAGVLSTLIWFFLLWGIGRRWFERRVQE